MQLDQSAMAKRSTVASLRKPQAVSERRIQRDETCRASRIPVLMAGVVSASRKTWRPGLVAVLNSADRQAALLTVTRLQMEHTYAQLAADPGQGESPPGGTRLPIDRLDPLGRLPKHETNVQIIADAFGRLLRASPAPRRRPRPPRSPRTRRRRSP